MWNQIYIHTNTPYLIRLCVVSHGSRHDDSGVQTVLDALNKCVLLVLWGLSEAFTDVLQASHGLIVQLHPRFSGDYFNLSCNQESQSATGPWDSVEQVWVFFLCDRKMYLLLGLGLEQTTNRSTAHLVMMDVVSVLWVSNVRIFVVHVAFTTDPLANLIESITLRRPLFTLYLVWHLHVTVKNYSATLGPGL